MTDPGTRAGGGTSDGAARGAAPGSRTPAAAVVHALHVTGIVIACVAAGGAALAALLPSVRNVSVLAD